MEEKINEEVSKGAGFAALSYLLFLCIPVLIYKKDNSFTRYHAKQALVLFLGWLSCLLFSAIIPLIGGIFIFLGNFVYVLSMIVGIFSSLMGLKVRLPLISGIAERMVI